MGKKIYIVNSYTATVPGQLIRIRAKLKFWNRYLGDTYSHVSLSKDDKLNNMMSFARKEIINPFNAGLVKEDIRKGMFSLHPTKSKISVIAFDVTQNQYDSIGEIMQSYWAKREELHFNFAGLFSMLLYAKGVQKENCFFCSQWVATVLKEAGIDLFHNKEPHDVKPFDFYATLQNNIIYEGLAINYTNLILQQKQKTC